MESQIAPGAASDLHSRNRLLMQYFQADSLIPMIAQKLDPLDQCVRQKKKIILKRNSLHLAFSTQPEGKQLSLVQDRIIALFPKHNGDTKQLVPCRNRGTAEKMRRAQMLAPPVRQVGEPTVGGNGGEEASVGEMILCQAP